MTNKSTDSEPEKDQVEDDSDVTEIVPASVPKSEGDGSDATQILPMRSASEPTQQLPGTVIGRVGGASVGSATSEPRPEPAPGGVPDSEDEATKILFSSPSKVPDTEPSQVESKTDSDQAANEDGVPPKSEVAQDQEKTAFLTPVSKPDDQHDFNPPVGWLIVVDGPGRGAVLDIHYGQNTIGRGASQQIQLNFGDALISRETHAFVIYDEIERTFFLRDAGKKNLVRLNKAPVMTPTQLTSHDQIQIGNTTCLFVPLCNDTFDWLAGEDDPPTGPPEEGKAE